MALFSRGRPVVNLLRIFWVLVLLWYEYRIFSYSVKDCIWPDSAVYSHDLGVDSIPSNVAHVLLVADPQIIDRHSYPTRGWFLSHLTKFLVDLNLRKNWRAAVQKHPDVVVFLGDMMDSGRMVMSDEEYDEYFNRFNKIFTIDESIPVYFIPGNHDVGLGARIPQFSDTARARYSAHFVQPNRDISVANHTLVLFDAPSYADEDSQRHGQKKSYEKWVPNRNGALEYSKKFASKPHVDPVILFSHIPLHRTDGKPCGPLREKGTLRPGVGLGYQNTLEKQSSQRLLDAFNPVVVFSGDDHDYCEYTHLYQSHGSAKSVREVTVKTLSMVMNVRRPGFQLLSLAPTDARVEGKPTHADTPCLLPDQLGIYLVVYIPLLAISLLVVFASHIRLTRPYGRRSANIGNGFERNIHPDIEEGEGDSFALSSNGLSNSSSRQGLGWFKLESHQHRPGALVFFSKWGNQFKEMCSFLLPGKSGVASFRRSWLGAVMIDVRDIAIFPLCTFAMITWWVTTH